MLNISLNAAQIKVAVAANISYAMDDLVKEFNKTNPDIKVTVILGSSGKLTAQIMHGAPFHIFMSADMNYPNELYKNKKAINKPVVYALGSLALFSSKPQDFSNGINILENENIKKIAIANPKTAPYGKVAYEALKNANILKTVKKKLIYGESIAQTVSYTLLATDIGIIAKSSLYSKNMKQYTKNKNWVEIDTKLYAPMKQGLVLIKNSKEARAFYDFLQDEKAKKIFKAYGYLLP